MEGKTSNRSSCRTHWQMERSLATVVIQSSRSLLGLIRRRHGAASEGGPDTLLQSVGTAFSYTRRKPNSKSSTQRFKVGRSVGKGGTPFIPSLPSFSALSLSRANQITLETLGGAGPCPSVTSLLSVVGSSRRGRLLCFPGIRFGSVQGRWSFSPIILDDSPDELSSYHHRQVRSSATRLFLVRRASRGLRKLDFLIAKERSLRSVGTDEALEVLAGMCAFHLLRCRWAAPRGFRLESTWPTSPPRCE